MIIDVQGTSGAVGQSVHLEASVDTSNSVRLNYFHFPDLPLLDKYETGVTVNGNIKIVPATSSIQELVNFLDSVVDNNARVFYCWYNDFEFELCTGASAVTLSATFAAVLKLPTALTANTCYSASLYESQISQYSHFAVRIGSTRGFHNSDGFNAVIAKVRRDGSTVSNFHSFTIPQGFHHIIVQEVFFGFCRWRCS